MELPFITAGQIVNTHGIRGEVKLLPQGVEAEELAGCKTFYIGDKPWDCTASRIHKGCLLLKLRGVDDMNAALALKGKTVTVRREDVPLPEGGYFDEELAGLTAREGKIKKGSKIIFLHTGGLPGIYTKHHRVEFEKELMDGVTILE